MASRILLINSNRCTTPDPVFPIGLAHLNAALRRAGYQTSWADRLGGPSIEESVSRAEPDFIGISIRNIDDVLIRKRETFLPDLLSLMSELRRITSSPVILGGSGFSIFPRELFELAGADFGIIGEGESGLVDLISALESGGDFSPIPGLVFRRQGNITINLPSPALPEHGLTLEDSPDPVLAHYLNTSGMLNVQTQRGCSFRCCYCTYPVIEGRHHRRRPPESVASEFEQLQRRGARYLFVVDSVFNSSPAHVSEVCEALLRRNIQIPWGCFLRPQGLSPALVRLMARAGLKHIEFGSDSFCDDVLQSYRKDFTLDDIVRSSELARQEQIDFCHYVIAGGPGETMATLRRGFENSRRLGDAVVMAVVGMRIYPGTSLFDQAVAEGRIRPETNLIDPIYYLASGLEQEVVFKALQEFARTSPNWIVGDPEPSYQKLVVRLRQRGIVGPLWSYFSMIQQIRPHELAGLERRESRT
ncbi:MAG TPA: lipid biosynthesis B12-binding/radical SAM protein [Candidatus Limnocylindrales bacterium]|nr:lipid biosynthesis B12-binding/radical SAM protein [Candidatus Limnocylindrales bacterium]